MKTSPIGFAAHLSNHIRLYTADHGQRPAVIYVHTAIYKHFKTNTLEGINNPECVTFQGCLLLAHLHGGTGEMWSPIWGTERFSQKVVARTKAVRYL